MRSFFGRSFALVAVLVVGTACQGGGDAGAGPSTHDTLSAADATDAFSALVSTMVAFQFQVSIPPGTPAAINDTRSCASGGSLRTAGPSQRDQQSGLFTAEVRQTHTDCGARSDTDRLWTFTGDPDLRLVASFNTMTGASAVVVTGTVRYASLGATGTCSTAVTFSGAPNGTVTVTGTMCGQRIDATL